MAATLFRNLRLFDGLADALAEGMEVLVEGERIKEIADRRITSSSARVIDCGGRTLMPGLIDAHIHAYGVDADLGRLDKLPRSLQALQAAERLKDSLKRGFTSIRDAGGADWGLATTGVAGPDPQEGHPVGTVFVAVAGPDGRSRVKALLLTGDRTQIRDQTVVAVLDLLVDELQAPGV